MRKRERESNLEDTFSELIRQEMDGKDQTWVEETK